MHYAMHKLMCVCMLFWTASKQRRTVFDQAIDDLIPIALADQVRQRMAEHLPESSTALVEGPKKNARGRKVDHLYFRQTPTEFISVIQNLTPRQKEAVNELGFGPVLDFNITEIPGHLAYWVLKTFNLARCQIPLSGGGSLTLDEEDVHLTLGFPRGSTPISRPRGNQTNFAYNDLVAARCGKTRFKMTAPDIARVIRQEVDGGPDFKKMFMFLLENALIETPSDGNCKPKILNFIDDVDEISNLNWCGYVLSVLEAAYTSWSTAESPYFFGPIHFLVVSEINSALYFHLHTLLKLNICIIEATHY